MSTLFTITLINDAPGPLNFFFFQEPAQYSGGQQVFSNSLGTTYLGNHKATGGSYQFQLELQFYAGVQTGPTPLQVGVPIGIPSAMQAIDLNEAGTASLPNCVTDFTLNPMGLSAAHTLTDKTAPPVEPGAFRINTPIFDQNVNTYIGGAAVTKADSSTVLSNFVQLQPQAFADCQPQLKFYVALGQYQSGTAMTFDVVSLNPAVCDGTTGHTDFTVHYQSDGGWSVNTTPTTTSLVVTPKLESSSRTTPSALIPVQIYNEAGTGQVATGLATSTNAPLTISNISNPGAIHLRAGYQLQLAGKTLGVNCVNVNGNSATFA